MLFSSLFSSSSSSSSSSPTSPTLETTTTTTTTSANSAQSPSSQQQQQQPLSTRNPNDEFDPPLPKIWTPRTNLKLLLSGLAFFTFSIWSTRRATARKILSSIPPYYTSSIYHKPKVSGGAEAFEALHLATMNVLSFGMMGTGGVLYALDINGVEDMRRFVRKGEVEGEGGGLGGADVELEREVEGWVAKVLGEKFGKELQKEKERERSMLEGKKE
ncbi:hypothetical protein BO78DRAFT_377214 [Aspergillus sclerotiicarbonarius CBS 121057]|uniref:Altered inheritance of mitochondria protein 11 n=1 Tax=Aspergillus sclerotiicarbonarius (strain CBS 121057 / IBT 28362) TaxID=1448318 RepID=A0A319ENG8_ASPSB|nr:hypothetical protein BO78DRAFT_377214 [Aspergillus sclerotiicarbonarius CBS 121057]